MERTCVFCGRKGEKSEFVRFVRGRDGAVRLDPGQKAPGRGAYVCDDDRCFDGALKKKSLFKSLKVGQSVDSALLSEMVSELRRLWGERRLMQKTVRSPR